MEKTDCRRQHEALRARGYQVEPQVGTAGYFIDLAVRDPNAPGRYLLAIECDGASYHGARSAWDRDRLRQAVAASEPVTTAARYRKATLAREQSDTPMHEAALSRLAELALRVVDIEAPVHEADLTRRLMDAFGVTRAGSRIVDAIRAALQHGHRTQLFRCSGAFVYSATQDAVMVRDRSDFQNAERKIDRVAPEELDEALLAVIRQGFSMDPESAVAASIQLLGVGRASTRAVRPVLQPSLKTSARLRASSDRSNHRSSVAASAD